MPPKYKKKRNNNRKNRIKNKKDDDNSNRFNSDAGDSCNDVSKMIETIHLNSNNNNISSKNNMGWTEPSLLRFHVGSEVEYRIGSVWFLCKIINVNFKHKDWDHYAPYEMVLLKQKNHNNHNNHSSNRSNSNNKYDYNERVSATADSDEYIREVFKTTKEQKQTKGWTDPSLLRFRVGTEVECYTSERWVHGKIFRLNFKEDHWDHYVPYQVVLSKDCNSFEYDYSCPIYAPEDNDIGIRKPLFQTKEQEQTGFVNRYELNDYPQSKLFDVGWDFYFATPQQIDEAADVFKRGGENDGCVCCMFFYVRIQIDVHDNPHLAVPFYFELAIRGHGYSMDRLVDCYNASKPAQAMVLSSFWVKTHMKTKTKFSDNQSAEENRKEVKKAVANECCVCGKKKSEDNNDVTLVQCGVCKYYSYCGKKCQTYHWQEGKHMNECRQVILLRKYGKPSYVKEIREAIIDGQDPKEIRTLQRLRTKLGLNRPKEDYEELLLNLDDDNNNNNISKPGTKVKVKGLVKASIHNGKIGTVANSKVCTSSIPEEGHRRVGVKLSDDNGGTVVVAIKIKNLELSSVTASTAMQMTTTNIIHPTSYEYFVGRKDGTVQIGSTPNAI